MNLKNSLTLLSGLYIAILVWWFSLFFANSLDPIQIHMFTAFWTLSTLYLSSRVAVKLLNLRVPRQHENLASGLVLLTLGIILWCSGTVVWVIYNVFLDVQIPFPSLADSFYFSASPVISIGVFSLFLLKGNRGGIKKPLLMKLVVALLFAASSVFFLIFFGMVAFQLKIVLGVLYVLFDVFSLGFILSSFLLDMFISKSQDFDNYQKPILFIFLGIFFELVGDLGFLITTTSGTYQDAGLVDLSFISFIVFLSLGVLYFVRELFPYSDRDSNIVSSNYLIQLPYLKQISLNMIAFPIFVVISNLLLFYLGSLLLSS